MPLAIFKHQKTNTERVATTVSLTWPFLNVTLSFFSLPEWIGQKVRLFFKKKDLPLKWPSQTTLNWAVLRSPAKSE